MTEKRFTTDNGSNEDVCLVDNLTKKEYESNFEDIVDLMNNTWEQTKRFEKHNQYLEKENEALKKELHLMHMRGMFSTVKSFKGDISKRYTYSEETDNVYDVANHYGQYCKILSKKEMVMLLNEYETVLKELQE